MQKECHIYWHNMKSNKPKYNIEQFAYDLEVLRKMIWLSDGQILEHFKKSFPLKVEIQLYDIKDIDIPIGKG